MYVSSDGQNLISNYGLVRADLFIHFYCLLVQRQRPLCKIVDFILVPLVSVIAVLIHKCGSILCTKLCIFSLFYEHSDPSLSI